MTLLEHVRGAAQELAEIEEERKEARAELRRMIERAAAEGIPLAAIGRHANLSRQRIRVILGR